MAPAPDFSRNFLKLPRPVLRSLLARPVDLAVYALLLDRAAYADGSRPIGGRLVDLKVGQCVAGRRELAEATSTSERTIRTALARLENDQLITVATTKLGSTVTICGYSGTSPTRHDDRPSDSRASDQAIDQGPPVQATKGSTTTQTLRDLREEDSLPPRAIPGSTVPAAAPVADPMPAGWTLPADTDENRELLARCKDAGIDLAEEFAVLRDQGELHVDWNARGRTWLRRALNHAAERAAAIGRNGTAPRAERGDRDRDRQIRKERDIEREVIREQAQPIASADDRSAWLRQDLAAIAPDLGNPTADAPADASPDGEP